MWNGLLAPYGDYANNTGPIDVVSADLADFGAGFTSQATLQTQQIWAYRKGLAGRIWAVHIDPIRGSRALADGSLSYSYADAPGEWVTDQVVLPYCEHGFDLVETAEAVFICGATAPNADTGQAEGPAIWKSTDRGATWTLDLSVPSSDGFRRMYCFFDWGDGTLSAVAVGNSAAPQAYYREVGGTWTAYADPTLAEWGANPPEDSAGRLKDFAASPSDAHLFTYQGTPIQLVTVLGKENARIPSTPYCMVYGKPGADPTVIAAAQASVPFWAQDIAVSDDGQRAYVLSASGSPETSQLFRGDTDGNWTSRIVFDATYGDSGLAVDEDAGKVYFSTHASTVSRFALPA